MGLEIGPGEQVETGWAAVVAVVVEAVGVAGVAEVEAVAVAAEVVADMKDVVRDVTK